MRSRSFSRVLFSTDCKMGITSPRPMASTARVHRALQCASRSGSTARVVDSRQRAACVSTIDAAASPNVGTAADWTSARGSPPRPGDAAKVECAIPGFADRRRRVSAEPYVLPAALAHDAQDPLFGAAAPHVQIQPAAVGVASRFREPFDPLDGQSHCVVSMPYAPQYGSKTRPPSTLVGLRKYTGAYLAGQRLQGLAALRMPCSRGPPI